MTTEKYINTYRHQRMNITMINGMIRDLNDPDNSLKREERKMKLEALELLRREKHREI